MTSHPRTPNVLESMGDGIAVIARDWTVQYLNPRAVEMLLPPDPEAVGRSLWHALPGLAGGALEAALRRVLDSGQPVTCETFYQPSQRWLELRAWPSDEGVTCLLLDIHQRKLHERALRDSANRLEVALAAGKLGDWEWNADSNQVRLGRRAADIFDLPAEVPITWPLLRQRIDPVDFNTVQRTFLDASRARHDFNIECRIIRPSGERCWVTVLGHLSFDEHKQLQGVVGMVQDISVRKAAENILRNSEEQLRALANSIPQLAWIAGSDGSMLWYNERWYDYTGMTPAELDNWQRVNAPEALPDVLARWHESVRSGAPFEMEFPIRSKNGEYRWFLTRANPIRDAGGNVLRWFGTSTDVDQVKRVQEQLRDETMVLELLHRSGTALAQNRDLRALLQEVTDATTRISSARFGAFVQPGEGLVAVSGTPPPGFAGLQPGQALDGYPSTLVVPVPSRDSAPIGALCFGHPEPAMFTERTRRILGGIAAQAGIAIDNARMVDAAQRAADERKVLLDRERSARAEAERSSQMKDEFLATLSHELRTPLTAILGWSQVLRRGSRSPDDLSRGLETIERNARAQAQLIEDLLDMGRITSGKVLLDMRQLAPATVVDAAMDAVRPAAEAKGIRLERHFTAAGLVAGDASRLQQVVWNLLTNALKFTPRGGTVHVATSDSNGHVDIAVSDSGVGIRPEFLPYVFERFRQADASTTRRHGGLGLGLSIVKHLVEQHGGTVTAASPGEGLGASFTVRLPRATGEVRAQRLPAPPHSVVLPPPDLGLRDLRGLKVLLVDDESDARELISRILRDCNAAVQTAANAAEALSLARSERFELLLTDIGMPELDGFDLLSRLRALGPARGGTLPAIALTAFARPEDRLRALEAGFLDHVAKPVEPSEMIATISRVASASRDG